MRCKKIALCYVHYLFPGNTNICQLRLDFENLVLSTTNGATTSNYLAVDGPTDQDPPYISGTNTGYHSKVFILLAS